MLRYLKAAIMKDLDKKMILITGPRQVGKTVLSQSLLREYEYFNYDQPRDRKLIHKNLIDFNSGPIILDEIHKMKQWKRWLKGAFDTRKSKHPMIITGSAKFDTYKKMGDSMAGRYFQFRLMPLDVKELFEISKSPPNEVIDKLLELSGFPEPYLSGSPSEYKRWRSGHLDIILKQDLVSTESIKNISAVELLVELMTERAGNLISYKSLSEDLQTDDKSVKRWLEALVNSYVFFKITPYSKKINRSISKQPKYYFYDLPRVISAGTRFENLIALSLHKEILFRKDVLGEDYSLHFLRDRSQNEVDFLICHEKKPILMIEAKISENNLDHSFAIFAKPLGDIPKIILVKNLDKQFVLKNDVKVLRACDWLAKMPF